MSKVDKLGHKVTAASAKSLADKERIIKSLNDGLSKYGIVVNRCESLSFFVSFVSYQ